MATGCKMITFPDSQNAWLASAEGEGRSYSKNPAKKMGRTGCLLTRVSRWQSRWSGKANPVVSGPSASWHTYFSTSSGSGAQGTAVWLPQAPACRQPFLPRLFLSPWPAGETSSRKRPGGGDPVPVPEAQMHSSSAARQQGFVWWQTTRSHTAHETRHLVAARLCRKIHRCRRGDDGEVR